MMHGQINIKFGGTLHEEQYTSLTISHSILPKMRNVSHIILEKIKTHIFCSMNLKKKNRAFYEKMWRKFVERGRPQITI